MGLCFTTQNTKEGMMMKRTVSIIFIVILSTLLFALLMKICLIVGIGIFLGSSEETFLMSSQSPTGEYNLEAYKIEAGATVDFSIKVYKINGNHKKLIYNAYHESSVEIEWIDNSTVSINDKVLDLSLEQTYDWRR